MAGLKLTPIILKEVNKYLTTPKKVRKFGFDDTTVKTGEDIERPQKALDREMFKDGIEPESIQEIVEEVTGEAPSIKKAGGGIATMLGE